MSGAIATLLLFVITVALFRTINETLRELRAASRSKRSRNR
jgi:hypothetical protein